MERLRIGFDTDGPWVYKSYRYVLQAMMWEEAKYELYLITKDATNSPLEIAAQLGINPANVFYGIADNDAIVVQLNDSKIKIYLTPIMEVFTLTNETSVDTVAILVDSKQDIYNIQPKWFQQLKFWVNRLYSGQEEEC